MRFDNDQELIKALKTGDETACESLLDEYELPIYRFFYYSHGHHQTAQDQCGETFFRLMTAVQKNGTGCVNHMRAYLYGIARNILAEHYRKQSLMDEYRLKQHLPHQPSVYQQVSAQDELAYVWRIISQFDEPQRQILLLRFMENIRYEEIAAIMAMPINSVKSYIHRGRKKLCELLAENNSFEMR